MSDITDENDEEGNDGNHHNNHDGLSSILFLSRASGLALLLMNRSGLFSNRSFKAHLPFCMLHTECGQQLMDVPTNQPCVSPGQLD